jgi:hypothetical protein
MLAFPKITHTFAGWALSAGVGYQGQDNPATLTITGPVTEVAFFGYIPSSQITVTSQPAGVGYVMVDGFAIWTPTVFSWCINDTHTISAVTSVRGQTWQSWSDGGAQTHTYKVPSQDAAITATYYVPPHSVQVTVDSNPEGGGFVAVDGAQVLTPQAFNWTSGTQHTLSAPSMVNGATGVQYLWQSWSDGGQQSETVTVPDSASITYTARFKTQYYLTVQPSTGGQASPTSGWYDAGSQLQLSATPDSSYVFASWAGTGVGSYTGQNSQAQATMNDAITESAAFNLQQVTTVTTLQTTTTPTQTLTSITINSNGLSTGLITVDGSPATVPTTFDWPVGSTHTITATATGSGDSGVQYVWKSWSDSGAQSHTITVSDVPGTYTATYTTQYYLTVQSEAGGTATPDSAWYDEGALAQITATADNTHTFSAWTGSGTGSYTGSSSTAQIAVNGPITETATFSENQQVTTTTAQQTTTTPLTRVQVAITTNQQGSGMVTVDGEPVSSPQTFTWDTGSTHTISANSPVPCGTGFQYVWNSWSDGGDQTHTITVPSSNTTYTADFKMQYYLTLQTTNGSITPNAGWYDEGSQIRIQATPNTGYTLQSWIGSGTGSYSGTDNPAAITISGPITETANLQPTIIPPTQITITSSPAGNGFITVDGVPITTPKYFNWTINSTHALSAVQAVNGADSTRFTFTGWSDSSAPTRSISVPQTPTAYNANYETQYYLAVQTGAGGNVTPSSGWYAAEAQVQLHANANAGYTFQGWIGSGAGSYTGSANMTAVTMNGPIAEAASFTMNQVNITIRTNVGTTGAIIVDGSPIDTPQVFNWTMGSVHTIYANTMINGTQGTRYLWQSWSDGGQQEHTITVTSASAVYTASYATQYLLTIQTGPGGTATPSTGWHDANDQVQLAATPSNGYALTAWTGTGTGSYSGSNTQPLISVNEPTSESAAFTPAIFQTTVGSNPAGQGLVTVDGTPVTTPTTFEWQYGTTHTISAASTTPGSSGTQYAWHSWSDGGAQAHTYTVPGQSANLTATYQTQYYLTMQAGAGGTVSPPSGWQNSGSQVQMQATPNSNYQFTGWTGSGTGAYSGTGNPTAIAMNGPTTELANFQASTVQITVTSNQTGSAFVSVDGVGITTPHTFGWEVGSSHQLSANSPVSGGTGTQYSWLTWSDNGAQTHTVTVPNSTTTYTANYKTQYYLTVQAGTGGAVQPATGWQGAKTSVQISAAPNPNYAFSAWTGSSSGSYTGTSNPATVTMNGPITEQAAFNALPLTITVTSNPTGDGYVTVDGVAVTTPKAFTWNVGSAHTLAALSPVSCGSGCQYVFISWSDSGAQSHSVTVASSTTAYAANFQQQYYVTMTTGTGGTVTPSSHWQNAGSNVQIQATPNSNYAFAKWTGSGTGSYTGTANPYPMTMNGAITETASFSVPVQITVTSNPAGSSFVTVDGTLISTPKTYAWAVGSTHTVTASSTVNGVTGAQYVWKTWSDGGSMTHTIIVPIASTTYTATYTTQYYLTMQSTAGGAATPPSGWFQSGTVVSISATPTPGYIFQAWAGTGTGSYSGSTAAVKITMNSAIAETATFTLPSISVTVTSNPTGAGYVTVDGVAVTTPKAFTWTVGSIHTLSAKATVACGTGCQNAFQSWSDGGAASHTITTPNTPRTYTATYTTQYYLTMQATTGGAITPPSTWYASGAAVTITATPSTGYKIQSWTGSGSGSYSGTATTTMITMRGPITETATFTKPSIAITVTSNPAGSGYVVVDGASVKTPAALTWTIGSSHTMAAQAKVNCGSNCQQVWVSWSDGGSQSHTIFTPSNPTTYTAQYKTQYYVTVQAGSGGKASPSSGWYDYGQSITIQAQPASDYKFSKWTGAGTGSYTGLAATVTITVKGSFVETATFVGIISRGRVEKLL